MLKLIQKIKKHKQEKIFYQYIAQHKKRILRAFYEMMRCKDLEWIIQDPTIFNTLWIRALEHDDDWYESPYFETFRQYFYPINQKEKNKIIPKFAELQEEYKQSHTYCWQSRLNKTEMTTELEIDCLEEIMSWLADSYITGTRPYKVYESLLDSKIPKKQLEFFRKCTYEGIDKTFLLLQEGKIDVLDIL